MEIKGVYFFAGREALDTLRRVQMLRDWVGHLVLYGGNRVATAVTADTQPRLTAMHKLAIAHAVDEEGSRWFVGPLESQYLGRMSRQVLGRAIKDAEEAAAMPHPSPADYMPITAPSVPLIFSRDGHGHS